MQLKLNFLKYISWDDCTLQKREFIAEGVTEIGTHTPPPPQSLEKKSGSVHDPIYNVHCKLWAFEVRF